MEVCQGRGSNPERRCSFKKKKKPQASVSLFLLFAIIIIFHLDLDWPDKSVLVPGLGSVWLRCQWMVLYRRVEFMCVCGCSSGSVLCNEGRGCWVIWGWIYSEQLVSRLERTKDTAGGRPRPGCFVFRSVHAIIPRPAPAGTLAPQIRKDKTLFMRRRKLRHEVIWVLFLPPSPLFPGALLMWKSHSTHITLPWDIYRTKLKIFVFYNLHIKKTLSMRNQWWAFTKSLTASLLLRQIKLMIQQSDTFRGSTFML